MDTRGMDTTPVTGFHFDDAPEGAPPGAPSPEASAAAFSAEAPNPVFPEPDPEFPPLPNVRYNGFLAEGGMGRLFRAFHLGLSMPVAVKVLKPEVASPAMLEQFIEEARIAARIRHAHVVRVLDCGISQGRPFIVMEYVEGESSADLVEREGPLPWQRAAHIVRCVARGLSVLHQAQITHCDIKPSNILLGKDGSVVLADFGLARRNLGGEGPLKPRTLLGTLQYMAPEQVRNPGHADVSSDLYSLGASFFHLLSGDTPFTGSILKVLQALMTDQAPPRLESLKPGIPLALCELTHRMIDVNPSHRPASAAAVEQELDQVLARCAAPRAAQRSGAARGGLPRRAVDFAFLGYGSSADPCGDGIPRLYLDVGNSLGPGVIDQHHLLAYMGSTTSLLRQHPEFVRATLNPGAVPPEVYTILVHQQPDLDCVCAAFLAVGLLCDGELPEGAEVLSHYTDRVDAGYSGTIPENPFSLYTAYVYLSHRLSLRAWRCPEDGWSRRLAEGLELVGYALRESLRAGVSLWEVDAFGCPGLFSEVDRKEVRRDRDRYERKLADPECRARMSRLALPALFGSSREIDALMIRRVQGASDPDRCIFFKDWARSDTRRTETGFTFLSVYEPLSPTRGRAILSVKPESGLILRGLGEALDRSESELRRSREGRDPRLDSAPRQGYSNADPWYDGRAHVYTIVDAPREGTVLSADEVEARVLEFSAHSAIGPRAALPGPDQPTAAVTGESVRWYTFLARQWRWEMGEPPGDAVPSVLVWTVPDGEAWARENLVLPLRARLPAAAGPEAVRLFAASEPLGGPLLAELARWIERCRVFLPVLDASFLSREDCLWAFQSALTRDPRGEKGIVRPLFAEGTDLPRWCSELRRGTAIPAASPPALIEGIVQAFGR
ncbi:MAG: protein kinase [Acidobacteria bacterium]|nr:protein kinase [Acidobacteriota bacterium]